jgi:hypothetical protein
MPHNIDTKVKITEYPKELKVRTPCPRNPYLNASMIPVIGFSSINHLYFSGAALKG